MKNPCGNFPRNLYESLSVSFLTQLDSKSYEVVSDLILKTVLDPNAKQMLTKCIPRPTTGNYVYLAGFWVPTGSLEPNTPAKVS